MPNYSIGITDIKIQLEGALTDSPFKTLASIGEVAENSTNLSQEAPSETKIKGDYSDATLISIYAQGDFTLEADIIDIQPEKLKDLTGGTYDSATKTLKLPDIAPILFAKCELSFDSGVSKIILNKVQIVVNITGQNLKTEALKAHIKMIALKDATNGYVDVVFK